MKTFRMKNYSLWIFAVCFLTQNIFSGSLWALSPAEVSRGKEGLVAEKKLSDSEKTSKTKEFNPGAGGDLFGPMGDGALSAVKDEKKPETKVEVKPEPKPATPSKPTTPVKPTKPVKPAAPTRR